MTIRRQLINLVSKSVDIRVGSGGLEEISSYAKSCVGKPQRALFVYADGSLAEDVLKIEHGIVDAGFELNKLELKVGERGCGLADASKLFEELERCGITNDDLIVCLGNYSICSLAAWCGKNWGRGASVMLVPTALRAMLLVATYMKPLVGTSTARIGFAPDPTLVVCDFDFVRRESESSRKDGLLELALAMFTNGRNKWNAFVEQIPAIVELSEDELVQAVCDCQTAHKDIVRAANPGAKRALEFGMYSSRAIEACISETLAPYQLRAEGMRFEARLAHDVLDFEVDDIFSFDDALYDLGIEEVGFEASPERFVEELHRLVGIDSNRFMLSLPRKIGTVRLTPVDDEVLSRHAAAYFASRKELLEEGLEAE